MKYLKGYYEGEIQSQAFVQLPNANKTMALELVVRLDKKVAIDQTKTDVEPGLRTVTLFLTEKTIKFTREKLAELGLPLGTDLGILEPTHPNCFSLKGKRAVIRNKEDEGEKQYGKWELAQSKPPEIGRKSDPSVAQRVSAMFGGSTPASSGAMPSEMPF